MTSSVMERLATALADRYRIERKPGAGGMATVYLAEDLRHHRKVAMKVLHPEVARALGAERFLREIRLTAGLQHPHILYRMGILHEARRSSPSATSWTKQRALFSAYAHAFAVEKDPTRFILVETDSTKLAREIRVVTGWDPEPAGALRRAPARR